MTTFEQRLGLVDWCGRCGLHKREHQAQWTTSGTVLHCPEGPLPHSSGGRLHIPTSLEQRKAELRQRLEKASPEEKGAFLRGVLGVVDVQALWEDETEDLPIARAELENAPAVDHETFLICNFCQGKLGVRIVITKDGRGWVQVAAGAWVSFGEPVDKLQVRCATCLLPEV